MSDHSSALRLAAVANQSTLDKSVIDAMLAAADEIERLQSNLDAAVGEAVAITVNLSYDHWLKHGTPIRREDHIHVAADVKRACAIGGSDE